MLGSFFSVKDSYLFVFLFFRKSLKLFLDG